MVSSKSSDVNLVEMKALVCFLFFIKGISYSIMLLGQFGLGSAFILLNILWFIPLLF